MRRSRWIHVAIGALALAGCGDDEITTGGTGGGGGATVNGTVVTGATGGGGGSGDPCDSLDCGSDAFCYGGECRACGAPTGTQRDQVLPDGDDEEDRVYWLHVPRAYACSAPAPLLIDFHGTAGARDRKRHTSSTR